MLQTGCEKSREAAIEKIAVTSRYASQLIYD